MKALKALAVLPLFLAARVTRDPGYSRRALEVLVDLEERERALTWAVTVLEACSTPEGAEWYRDHVVPEEIRGEAWLRYEEALAA